MIMRIFVTGIFMCFCLLGCRFVHVDPVNLHGTIRVRKPLSALAENPNELLRPYATWPTNSPAFRGRPTLVLQPGAELQVDRVEIDNNDFEDSGVAIFLTVLTKEHKGTKLTIQFWTGLLIDEGDKKTGKPACPRFNPEYFETVGQ